MKKVLCKSVDNKKICGVCGGVGEYLDIDPTVVRIIWLLVVLLGGSGILVYIICAIVMPKESDINPHGI